MHQKKLIKILLFIVLSSIFFSGYDLEGCDCENNIYITMTDTHSPIQICNNKTVNGYNPAYFDVEFHSINSDHYNKRYCLLINYFPSDYILSWYQCYIFDPSNPIVEVEALAINEEFLNKDLDIDIKVRQGSETGEVIGHSKYNNITFTRTGGIDITNMTVQSDFAPYQNFFFSNIESNTNGNCDFNYEPTSNYENRPIVYIERRYLADVNCHYLGPFTSTYPEDLIFSTANLEFIFYSSCLRCASGLRLEIMVRNKPFAWPWAQWGSSFSHIQNNLHYSDSKSSISYDQSYQLIPLQDYKVEYYVWDLSTKKSVSLPSQSYFSFGMSPDTEQY